MTLKEILKSIFGEQMLSTLKGHVCHYGCQIHFMLNGKRIQFDSAKVELYKILAENGKHVFRGYYDLDYYSQPKDRFLCHRLPKDAKNNILTSCEIGYYSLSTGSWEFIANTNAWCWQQGSRLRWHPANQDKLLYNAVDGDHYCTKVVDVNSKKQIMQIDWPLYDVTPDFRYGLSLNFSRLQRLRPGYGYNYFSDNTEDKSAPGDDGVWLVDIQSNSTSLLYSLRELAEQIDNWEQYEHYINHISICPDGTKFIFFHIYTKRNAKNFKVVLYISDIQGQHRVALESIDRASHYCWIDNNRLMVTLKKEDGSEYYSIFDTQTKKKNMLSMSKLDCDGHPSPLAFDNLFITDTYPLEYSLQHLRVVNLDEKKVENIVDVYHDYRMRSEIRCDLHPSITVDKEYISIDSTYDKEKRCVLVFRNLIKSDIQ